jgi:hypothetical protein
MDCFAALAMTPMGSVTSLTAEATVVCEGFRIKAEEAIMTKDRTTGTRADASKRELTEEQLEIVSGGVVSPRDVASGLPTGKRMHKPYTFLAEFRL